MVRILLLSIDPTTLALMRAASDAFESSLDAFSDAADLKRKLNKPTDADSLIVIIDLASVALAGLRIANLCRHIKQVDATAKIGLIASASHHIVAAAEDWATQAGADVLVGQINAWRWTATGERLLKVLLNSDERVDAASRRVKPYLRVAMHATGASGNSVQARLIADAEAMGIDLTALAFRMQRSGGVDIADRRYRLRIYPDCFVADEGVTWLQRGLAVSKEKAIAIGQALQAAGLVYHVAREQPFQDESLFFRVAQIPPRWDIEAFYALARSSSGLDVKDRSYRGTVYPRSFVGSEAVEWMQVQGSSVNEALSMGQQLVDLSLIHHVHDEHPFKHENLFYRFYRDE